MTKCLSWVGPVQTAFKSVLVFLFDQYSTKGLSNNICFDIDENRIELI